MLCAGFFCLLHVSAVPTTTGDTGYLHQKVASQDSVFTRQALFARFNEERKLLAVFGASTPHMKEQMRRVLQESSWRWRTNLEVKHVDEITPADLQGSALLIVGTPATNILLSQLPVEFPVVFGADGFSFQGKKYLEKDVISMVHPSSQNPRYPMFMVAGWDEGAILSALNDRVRVYDYQIMRDGRRMRLGHFSQEAATLWQFDSEQDQDFDKDIKLVGTTDNFRFYTHSVAIDHNTLSGIIRVREENFNRVVAFAKDVPAMHKDQMYRYYLYPSLQDKAVITNSMQFSHVDHKEQSVHIAREEGIEGDALNKETTLVIRSWFGEPAVSALEDGLSVYLSENWFGKPYTFWADRIAHADLGMPVAELLDNDRYAASSPLIREVQAAAMVACMIDQWGKENFLEHYGSWTPAPGEWAGLEHMWTGCMETSKSRFVPLEKKELPANNAFQKGFNFAHEGYGIVNGYGSRAANKSIDKLKNMGSNAISIVPYTFMRNPNTAVPLRLANTAGDENDGAVAHATRYADGIGFTTMIKPQIWIRGSWPGDVEMQTPEEWEAFFGHYEHWITHYAMLSEIFNADILCIGTELSKATMFNEARWTTFANNLRSIYSGQMVYAPNWGEEFESLSFWDAFDYIGLNSYYPLSELDDPTDKELLAGAKAVVKKMEAAHKKFKKPILLTEIGYPNSNMPWKLPYQEDRQGLANPEHQARSYEAMVTALEGADWVKGIYWWKWPSYLDRGGMDHRGFTPNNKLAEKVVADWFKSF